jgi:hypothetical protein
MFWRGERMSVHYAGFGDSLTPLGAAFRQKNTAGRLVEVDLSDRTVTAIVYDDDGNEVLAESSIGVTITDATAGKVAYDFPDGENALPVGWYYIQFRAYGAGGESGERDTFPSPDPRLRKRIYIGTV